MASHALETLSAVRTQIVLLGTLVYFNTARLVFGGLDRRAVLLGAAFFVLMQSVYACDKMICSLEDRLNGVPPVRGFVWPARLLLLAALPAILYIISFEPLRWIIILIAVVLPLYSFEAPGRLRLKAVPVLKPVLNTALLFSASVLPPVLIKYGTGWPVIRGAVLSSWQLLVFMFSVTVLLDIRDVEGDRAAGIRTLPVVLGAGAAAALLGCGLALAAFSGLKSGNIPVAAVSLLIAAFLVPALWKKGRGYYELFLFSLNLFAAGQWIFV